MVTVKHWIYYLFKTVYVYNVYVHTHVWNNLEMTSMEYGTRGKYIP